MLTDKIGASVNVPPKNSAVTTKKAGFFHLVNSPDSKKSHSISLGSWKSLFQWLYFVTNLYKLVTNYNRKPLAASFDQHLRNLFPRLVLSQTK